ncbi:MAG: archaetidylserine decarboxylase [Ostreibacterium sp.]
MNPIFHALLPKKLLSAIMYRLARIKQAPVKNLIIRLFMKSTGASLVDAKRKNINDYESLLDFFTRELDGDVRPMAEGKDDIICPVDGRVAHVGDVENKQIFQIKGHSYSLDNLVGEDYAKDYKNGQSTTIYLAPCDYHRVHMPMDGKLLRSRYIPGELNSVSIILLDKIAGLFAKNERIVLEFETENNSKYLMVLVGAVNVGSIETIFHGEICPNNFTHQVELSANGETLNKGDELGRFNLGSTIIFISPPNHHHWIIEDNKRTSLGQLMAQRNATSL